MEEEKPKEEPKVEEPKVEEKYETTPLIERAREEREKMEAATKAMKAENDKREQIQTRQELGGQSDAGQPQEKPKEETPVEYKNRIIKEGLI